MSYPDLDAALYGKLSGDATIITLVGTRISYMQAPPKQTLPYIIYYEAATNFPNDHKGERGNSVYRVEAVASTRASALAIGQAVYDALHLQSLTLSGWQMWWLAIEQKVQLSDTVNGIEYHRIVQNVRVRFDKE